MSTISVAPRRFLEDVGVVDGREVRPGLRTSLHQVSEAGQYTAAEVDIYGDQEALQARLESVAPTLAWVGFNALDSYEADRPVVVPDTRFVAERTPTGLVFLTRQEIFREGELRSDMREWLGALVNPYEVIGNDHNSLLSML